MRRIRNSCASFMTGNRNQITAREQRIWWTTLNHDSIRCWLFYEDSTAVGYGLIREEDGKSWLTAGLIPESRDHGLGREAFECLIQMSWHEPWLKVLASNHRARKLYENMGFEITDERDGIATMRYGAID